MKQPRIYRLARAERDLLEHFEYLLGENPEAALRFVDAVEDAYKSLVAMPLMGVARPFNKPGLDDLRMWSVPDFEKFLIFYRPRPDGIEVVRVLYGMRDIPALMEGQEH
ncbi:MAG: type II toxin-antitoxin system RelE/ParE family toxin [Candidatus Competibacter denitrificans]